MKKKLPVLSVLSLAVALGPIHRSNIRFAENAEVTPPEKPVGEEAEVKPPKEEAKPDGKKDEKIATPLQKARAAIAAKATLVAKNDGLAAELKKLKADHAALVKDHAGLKAKVDAYEAAETKFNADRAELDQAIEELDQLVAGKTAENLERLNISPAALPKGPAEAVKGKDDVDNDAHALFDQYESMKGPERHEFFLKHEAILGKPRPAKK